MGLKALDRDRGGVPAGSMCEERVELLKINPAGGGKAAEAGKMAGSHCSSVSISEMASAASGRRAGEADILEMR